MSAITRLFSGPIAKATLSTSIVLGLRLVVQAGTLLIVARLLGAAQFGAYSSIVALAVVLGALATFGTHIVLLGETSKEVIRRRVVLPYALPTTLLASVFLFLIYVTVASWIMKQTGIGTEIILAIGLSELILQPLIILASVEHQAHGHIARSQMLMALPLGLRLLMALGVWVIQPQDPLTLFALGYLFVTSLALGIAAQHLPEPWPKLRVWRLASKDELKQSASYGFVSLTALSPNELDKTIAVKLMPLEAAGVYAVGTRIIGALTLPIMAMLASVSPKLFKINETKDSAKLSYLLFGISISYGWIAAAGIWATAPIFPRLFGAGYQSLEVQLHMLAFSAPAIALQMAGGVVLVTLSRPWTRAGTELIGGLILITAALALAPQMGAAGMALALTISAWSMALLSWFFIHKIYKEE